MTLSCNHCPLDCIVEVRCAITLPFHPIQITNDAHTSVRARVLVLVHGSYLSNA